MSCERRIAIVCLLTAQACLLASANPISVNEVVGDFGHLDQHKTKCPTRSCGPTAAVNSFVYLQNTYPMVYFHNLAGLSEGSEIDTANSLVMSMGTCVKDNQGNETCKNTTWENFYLAKASYIDLHAPGTSNYSSESAFSWAPGEAGGAGKPPAVADNTKPTADYLINQLQQKRDVELEVETVDKTLGHYITVTGITWDPDTMLGSLSFVDPDNGGDKSRDIFINNGYLSWKRPSDNKIVEIQTAVSEGPVPEPVTNLTAGAGLILVGWTAGRRLKVKMDPQRQFETPAPKQ
jgi:hypothetical protein